jgi:hypothetical protein
MPLRTPLEFKLAVMTARLRYEASTMRVIRAAKALERHYRDDQARAPNGRWIDDPRSVRREPVDTSEVADLTMFGKLVGNHRYGTDLLLCVYDFGSQKWTILYNTTSTVGCWDMVHQVDAFSRGTRLNDN